MEKNYNIGNIEKTVLNNKEFFQKYYYHSVIDCNPAKIESIMRHGILCKNDIVKNGCIQILTYPFGSPRATNGSKYVSLSKYNGEDRLTTFGSAFGFHTLTSVSFMVDNDLEVQEQGEKEMGFYDEVFYKGSIDKSKISGIIVPTTLANTKISKASFLTGDIQNFQPDYILGLVDKMKKYYSCRVSESYMNDLNKSIDQFWDVCDGYDNPAKWLSGVLRTQRERYGTDVLDALGKIVNHFCFCEYNVNNDTILELLKKINVRDIPIYEIGKDSVSRVRK